MWGLRMIAALLCGAVGGAIASTWLTPSEMPAPLTPGPATSVDLDARPASPDHGLHARLARLESALQSTQSVAETGMAAHDQAASERQLDGANPIEVQAQLEHERLELAWQGEARDARWARAYESEIIASFEHPVFAGSRLIDASCRSDLCRLRVAHDTPEASEGFVERLIEHAPAGQGGFARENPDGQDRGETLVFLARKGSLVMLAQ